MTEPSLAEQIEACERVSGDALILFPDRAKLRAAARTLHRVQECRQRMEEQIANGVTVYDDIEGLVA